MFFFKFLSSILVGTIEKNISLNLIKIILKFDFILITYSKSLEFGIRSLLDSRGTVVEIIIRREASNLFFILVSYFQIKL